MATITLMHLVRFRQDLHVSDVLDVSFLLCSNFYNPAMPEFADGLKHLEAQPRLVVLIFEEVQNER